MQIQSNFSGTNKNNIQKKIEILTPREEIYKTLKKQSEKMNELTCIIFCLFFIPLSPLMPPKSGIHSQ